MDGQQRLTTLLLLSCALLTAIENHKDDVNEVSDYHTKTWIKQELQEQLTRLYSCTTGQRQNYREPTTLFPRMVRTGDNRAQDENHSEYKSPIADFLNQFRKSGKYELAELPASNEQENYLLKIYRYIYYSIERFGYSGKIEREDPEGDLDPPLLSRGDFGYAGCRSLFTKLRDIGKQSEIDKSVSYIKESADSERIIRLLLFSSYLTEEVVLTVVEAKNEKYAFSIFDALNTTGEPLTALETLKPLVVEFERNQRQGFAGSSSEESWKSLKRMS